MPWTLIWSAVTGGLSSVLSFLTKPPGLYLGIAIAFALALWWFGQHEFSRGEAACEASHVKANQHEVVRQKKAGDDAVHGSDARTAPHKRQDDTNKTNVRFIYVHDKALPDAAAVCVNPDDADRLRDIK